MNEKVHVMISQEKVEKRIRKLASQISRDYEGKSLHLICILKGSVFFTCDLVKYLTVPVTLDFMSVSSYGDATVSTGRVKVLKDLDEPIQDKEIMIVEDIIDSGKTLSFLINLMQARGPASIKICTLLDKPDRREVEVDVDYKGFEIPDKFVVGYGLDYEQNYRNLPYIGMIEF